MKLTVIRHCQTIANANGVIQGQLPGELSEFGREQAKEVAELLKDMHFNQAWSSDLKRTVDTARIVLVPHPNLKLQLSPKLREYNFGTQQGKLVSSWDWPRIGNPLEAKAEGGEDTTQVTRRLLDFINTLLVKSPTDSILIVTHGGPIRIMRTIIEKKHLSDFIDVEVPHTIPIEFEVNEPLKISSLRW